MAKSPDAFRTISEVSDALDTPPHVLRFWESKFTQVKPVKRAGGRRYYRPDDMALLAGIKTLLHDQGMTIKGAQKLLRDQGVKHVIALAGDAPEPAGEIIDHGPAPQASVHDQTPTTADIVAMPARSPGPALVTSNRSLAYVFGADPKQICAASRDIAPILDRLGDLHRRLSQPR